MTDPGKAIAAFEEAGFRFDIRHFDHRLMAQKLVYLMEELGVVMGYKGTFGFYLRGTYSPALTRDLFRSAQDGAGPQGRLSTEERSRIARLRSSVELRPHLLEVMAAYRYLRSGGLSEVEAIHRIKSTKPFLSERDVAIGISKCKGIFPEVTEEDHAALAEEMAPWDAASDEDA